MTHKQSPSKSLRVFVAGGFCDGIETKLGRGRLRDVAQMAQGLGWR